MSTSSFTCSACSLCFFLRTNQLSTQIRNSLESLESIPSLLNGGYGGGRIDQLRVAEPGPETASITKQDHNRHTKTHRIKERKRFAEI
jgi:hypothetical protein